jgi:hypothetical protein
MYQIFLLLTLIGILQSQSILSGYGNSATAKIYPMFNSQGTDSDRNIIATMERNCHILSLPVTTAPITDDSWESWNFCTLLTPPEDQLIDTSVDLTKMFAVNKSGLFVTDANIGGKKNWTPLLGLTCVPKRLYAHHYMDTAQSYRGSNPPNTISCLTVICEKDILHGTYKKLVLHPQAVATPIVDGIIFLKTLDDGPHLNVFYWTEDFNLYIYDVKTKTLKTAKAPFSNPIAKALHTTASIFVATSEGGLFLYDDRSLTLTSTILAEDGIPVSLGTGALPTPTPGSEYFISGLLSVKGDQVRVVRTAKFQKRLYLPQKTDWTSINFVLGVTDNPLAQVDFGFPILSVGTSIGEVKLSSFAADWLEQWTVSPLIGYASQVHEIQFVFIQNTLNLLAATKFGQILTHKFTTPLRWASPTYKEDVTIYAQNKTTKFVFNEYQIMWGYCFWASAAALYQYYKKPSEPYLDQFDLAQKYHDPPIDPSINCRVTPDLCRTANVHTAIPNTFRALKLTQHSIGVADYALTKEMIRFEINNNRPIGLSVYAYSNGITIGGHFVIISGYKEDALQTDMFIFLNDPSERGFEKFWVPYETYPNIVYKLARYEIFRYYLTYYNY